MKNAPFYALLGVVAVVVGALILAVYLQAVSGALPENAASGVCLIAFLVIATILYELAAKPGLYLRRKRVEDEEEKKEPSEGEAGEGVQEQESPKP